MGINNYLPWRVYGRHFCSVRKCTGVEIVSMLRACSQQQHVDDQQIVAQPLQLWRELQQWVQQMKV